MNLNVLSIKILLSLSALLGVTSTPNKMAAWQTLQDWKPSGDFYIYQASSDTIADQCRSTPNGFVKFPAIVHGAHTLTLDGQLISSFGDPSFRTVHSFYGAPVVSCKQLTAGKRLVWTVTSYTRYFARIGYSPYIVTEYPLYNLFAETIHIIGAGAALLMALFTLIMFFGKVRSALVYSVSAACFLSFFYFASCVSEFFGFRWDMLTAHKVADVAVWASIGLMFNSFRIEGLIGNRFFTVYVGSIFIGTSMIIFGTSGDMVQFGTSFPFSLSVLILVLSMLPLIKKLASGQRDKRVFLQLLSLGSFVSACFNEMFVVSGLIFSSPVLPIGFMGGVLFFVFSVNDRVTETYIERDYLRSNLEHEVQRQTFELKTKSDALERALVTLKTTQAELVQSAKLASLGTLSAGIAHEINNSLNYANGAMGVLEKILRKLPEDFMDRAKIEKLMVVMKDGLNLTLEIVKSFRTYTGLNQAKHNDVNITEVVNSAVTILKSRIRGKIEILNEVPTGLRIYGNVIGLNQVFMNLISNAIDAMPEGGSLKISAVESKDEVVLMVCDSGHGIPKSVMERIFDPFFTTKDVGKGTGLGLHIVKNEMDRHFGKVEVQSEESKGTTFTLYFPKGKLETENVLQQQMSERKAI